MNFILGIFLASTAVAMTNGYEAKFPLSEETLIGKSHDCSEVDDCQDVPGQETQICATNGKTFKSLCHFMRAHCKEQNVKIKNYGQCSASEQCLGQQRAAIQDAKFKKGVFIPECKEDGTFKPVQCHKHTEHCWCATPAGNAIQGTVTHKAKPNCKNTTTTRPPAESASTQRSIIWQKGRCEGQKRKKFNKNMLKNMIQEYKRNNMNKEKWSDFELQRATLQWKFNELNTRKDAHLKRSEYKGLQKIIRRNFKPKKCSKKFPKFCDLNGDKNISLQEWIQCFTTKGIRKEGSGRKKAPKFKTKPRPCEYENMQALESSNVDGYVPKCDKQGKFRPVQCYGSNTTSDSWYCFCVNVETGDMIESSSTRYGTPNCSVLWPHCPPPQKEETFLKSLMSYFVKFARERIYTKRDMKINEDNVIEIFFKFIDKNENNVIDGKEKRALRKSISKKNKRVWPCGRKIHVVCDSNDDGRISLQEFFTCVSPKKDHHSSNESFVNVSSSGVRIKGKNPFIEVIKSETR